MVSQATALHRTFSIWEPGSVPYSQSALHYPDLYRTDCSGYVSMCWAIPLDGYWGGPSTVTLLSDGWMTEIPFSELGPADAVGLCGPNTAGNAGHIQFVESYNAPFGSAVIWEQAGGVWGPQRRQLKRITAGYKAYRFTNLDSGGGDDMTPEQAQQLKDIWWALFQDALGAEGRRPGTSLAGLAAISSDSVNLVLTGVSRYGAAGDDPDPQIRDHVPGNDLRSVAARLGSGVVDTDALAKLLAPALSSALSSNDGFLDAVANRVADVQASRLVK